MPDDEQDETYSAFVSLSTERDWARDRHRHRVPHGVCGPPPATELDAGDGLPRWQRIRRYGGPSLVVVALLLLGTFAVIEDGDSNRTAGETTLATTAATGHATVPATTPPTVPATTTAWVPITGLRGDLGDYAIGSHWLTVGGVRLLFDVPAHGWEPWQPFGGRLMAKNNGLNGQDAEAIIFWTGLGETEAFPDGSHAEPCTSLPSRSNPSPPAAIADAIANAPGIEAVTGPTEVSVGGYPAQHVAVVVRDTLGCDPGYFYAWNTFKGGAFWLTSEIGDTINVWIVDVHGTLLFIAGEAHSGAGTPLVTEIHQIVASIRLRPASGAGNQRTTIADRL